MKKTLLFVCSMLISMSTNAADFESAKDAVKNMGVGWNLGNTLDAVDWEGKDGWNFNSPEEHETKWGQPVTKPELMKMMKEAGFGAIRVPVTWFQEMDSNGKVNAAWMKRVHEVVDYVIDNGMYCILNVHHDTGEGEDHWLYANTTCYNNVKDTYQYLWQQIAAEFKDYGQELLFESYNEMLDKYGSWNYAMSNRTGGYDETEAKDAYDAINQFAQLFVNTVRSSGGNNDKRNLVVNTYGACCGGKWGNNELPMEPLKQMELPDDKTEGHLIFQIHSYPGLKSNNLSSIKTQVTTMMSDLKTVLAAKGAPVIIGEWGTLNDNSDVNYKNNKTNYLDFCTHFVTEAKKNDIATFYWMGLSDGASRSLPAFNQPDLAETIVKAYHGSDFKGIFPTNDDFQTQYVVKWEQDWSELFLYGDWNVVTPLKLSDYKAVSVEMAEIPAEGSLQIKVYGDPDGKNSDGSAKFKEGYYTLSPDSKTTSVTFDQAATGSVVSRLTLQTNVGATQATITKAVLIKSDNTEVALTPAIAWGCSMTTESTPKPTGIQSVKAMQPESDGAVYTLSGQRVASPRKGIYIQNGKKIMVR